MSNEIDISEIFNGLFLQPGFEQDKEILSSNDRGQLVLTNFDENVLLNYYELERLAYDMWLAGAKSRIVAKGANLVVELSSEEILFDDRNEDLAWLTENYDKRTTKMEASATGTVFSLPDVTDPGHILLVDILAEEKGRSYSAPITKLLEISFLGGHFPNFTFYSFDVKTYLAVHQEFGADFENKWHASLNYVVAVLTDIANAMSAKILVKKISSLPEMRCREAIDFTNGRNCGRA